MSREEASSSEVAYPLHVVEEGGQSVFSMKEARLCKVGR